MRTARCLTLSAPPLPRRDYFQDCHFFDFSHIFSIRRRHFGQIDAIIFMFRRRLRLIFQFRHICCATVTRHDAADSRFTPLILIFHADDAIISFLRFSPFRFSAIFAAAAFRISALMPLIFRSFHAMIDAASC